MIRINLLPYWERKKEAGFKRQIFFLGGSLGLFVLVILGVFLFFSLTVAGLTKEEEELKKRAELLAKQAGDVEAFKRDKAEVEKKLAVINLLEERRFSAVKFLDELSSLTPVKDVWLDRVRQEANVIQLEGFARDNVAVARLMRNAELTGRFKSVELIISKQTEMEKISVQQFLLRFVLEEKAKPIPDKGI